MSNTDNSEQVVYLSESHPESLPLEFSNEKTVKQLSIELEESIGKCWGVVDELKELTKNVMERDLSQDDISNILIGLYTIYEYKFQDLKMIEEALIKKVNQSIDIK